MRIEKEINKKYSLTYNKIYITIYLVGFGITNERKKAYRRMNDYKPALDAEERG